MTTWSRNHRACETTWTTLYSLGQLQATFDDAGALPMPQLTFWTQLENSRSVRAQALAAQMDGIFTKVRGAVYETGVTQQAAVGACATALLEETGTVADLAAVCDAKYRFWGEDTPSPAAGASGGGT